MSYLTAIKDCAVNPSIGQSKRDAKKEALEDRIAEGLLSYPYPKPAAEKSVHDGRMSTLKSVAVLGIDIKITPEGDVKVIEVNGVESGMKGFEKAGVTEEETIRALLRGTLHTVLSGLVSASLKGDNPVEAAIDRHINGLGRTGVTIVGRVLRSRGICQDRFYGGDMQGVFDSVDGVMAGGKCRRIGEKLVAVEKILNDKMETDRHFDKCRDIKYETYYRTYLAEEMLRSKNIRYAITKPVDGRCGDSLSIIDLENKDMQLTFRSHGGMVIEPFIPSKPILSARDGQMHDGCMRYIMFAEEDKKGSIALYHFGGYWRLSPEPMSAGMKLDAVRANLAKGAFAEKASEEDLDLVAKVLNANIPQFYRSMIDSLS